MNTIPYEIGKSYPLRNGGRAVIGYVFENGVAYGIYSHDDAEDYVCPMTWRPDGSCSDHRSAFDILHPEPQTESMWVNVHRGSSGRLFMSTGFYCSREAADNPHYMAPNRVGCHRITLRAVFEEDAP